MKLVFERLAILLVPSLQIPKRTWISPWNEQQRKEFISSARLVFVAWALCWVLHFFLIDIPQKKEPLSWWASYRFGLAGGATLGFALTFFTISQKDLFYKIPMAVLGIAAVYMQGMSMSMRTQIPFFYVPLLAFLFTLALRSNPLVSLIYFGVNLMVSTEWFLLRPLETHHMVSSSVLGAVLLFYLRGRQNIEVLNFVLEQQKLEAHRNLIELQTQMNDQLKMFLPKKIYSDVERKISVEGLSPLQASDEVLRPRKVNCVILYSDIRGYTRMGRIGVEALQGSVMRAQRMTTDAVERFGGVPRLQGDLVFAYFDSNEPSANIHNAISAAIEIFNRTESLNLELPNEQKIKRFMILASGEVLVGNLGGTEGSRDISVLGDAANLPSRIDALTKDPRAVELSRRPILLSASVMTEIEKIGISAVAHEVLLKDLGIEIKDFPNEDRVYSMSPAENGHLGMVADNVVKMDRRTESQAETKERKIA